MIHISFVFCESGYGLCYYFFPYLYLYQFIYFHIIVYRLRARIDRAVGTEGAPSLTKLLQRLPNLEELRYYVQ